MTRGNGAMSRDVLMRDVERRSLAAFAFDPSAIRRHHASPEWFRDPPYRSMFRAMRSFAVEHPDERAVSGVEIEEHCRRNPDLAGLVSSDGSTTRLDQFTAEEFDLATQDGFDVSGTVESLCRVLGGDAEKRMLMERLGEIAGPNSDADSIRAGLRQILANDASSIGADPILGPDDILPIAKLVERHPTLRQPVIDGVLRQGETLNFIAAAKVGKSWAAYGMALSVCVGGRWLGRFPCRPGRVLLIDNELHPEVLASRIPTVAKAMGLRQEEYGDQLAVLPLRGRLTSIEGLGTVLRKLEQGRYAVIVLDALYRLLPGGSSENDNAGMAAVYNLVDQYAAATGAAFVLVHHASKGGQADKAVTDVGAGAGAQSRAADSHLILRPHEEENCVVLDAVVRSFAPIEPMALRWEFPRWVPADELDPEKLKRLPTRQEQQQQGRDAEGFDAIVIAIRKQGPLTVSKLQDATGIGRERVKRLVSVMRADGRLEADETEIRGNSTTEYRLAEYLQNA